MLRVTFPDSARRTRARNIRTSARTGFSEDITLSMFLGGARGANYASEYRAVDGVMLSTRRRVFAYDDARQKVPDPILVSIDLSEIHFT